MTDERAEVIAEIVEDAADPIEFYIRMQQEWEARWDFVPGEGVREYSPELEEQAAYLDFIERGAY